MGKVINILADGREVDNLDGYVIPASGPTEQLYWFLVERWEKQKKQEKEQERKEQQNG